MPGIFISYRRDDSAYIAAAINEKFQQRFGEDHVFFDIDTIPLGVDFRDHIGGAVGGCDALLVVIGDQWVEAKDKDGQQRLHQPTDYVRVEIESALQRSVPVVPVLVGNAMMPTEAQLPESIRDLAFRNAAEVRAGRDLNEHLERLVRDVGNVAGISPTQPPSGTQSSSLAPNTKTANASAATQPAEQTKSRASLMVVGFSIVIALGVAIAFATGMFGASDNDPNVAMNRNVSKSAGTSKDNTGKEETGKNEKASSPAKDVVAINPSVNDSPVKEPPIRIGLPKETLTKTEPRLKDAGFKDSNSKDTGNKADAVDSIDDPPTRDPKAVDRSDAKATAIAILTAIKAKDFQTLSTLVREDKRKEFADLAALTAEHPRYSNIFAGWRGEAINTWTGQVESPRYEKRASDAGRIKAIVRFEQKSLTPLVVVAMYLNDGRWEFEDLESPPAIMYRKMSTEQPK